MRSYRQFCPAARALDLVGERWTLLVIRELLTGPKRYSDLQAGLPGVGPNVLAARLRGLEDNGLLERRQLPPPAASTVYALTELGEGLRPVLLGLFQWGLQLLDAPGRHDAVRASYWVPAIEASARAGVLGADTDDVYEFRIGGESVNVRASKGEVHTAAGPADAPDVVVSTDPATFAELGRGSITPGAAVEAGRLSVEGDASAAERCAALFAAPVRASDGART
jgi:DNA-binding HxlR family transcriptional regulator/putative sterol carrier protein